jgi:hypothetical protein
LAGAVEATSLDLVLVVVDVARLLKVLGNKGHGLTPPTMTRPCWQLSITKSCIVQAQSQWTWRAVLQP